MNDSPLLLSAKDNELLGEASRQDAMGVLAIWSVRGRDLVPHLTEQTTIVRGFQILVEAFRLWEFYERAHPEHAGRLDDFFVLIEQAFARTVGWRDKDWQLPGTNRVRARSSDEPWISLQDSGWHLLGSQKANGLWGLYRGASSRAGLLRGDMTRLSAETMEHAVNTGINGLAQASLFDTVQNAMDGKTAQLPPDLNDQTNRAIYDTYWNLPLADHLHERLVEGYELNRELAGRLLKVEKLDHRTLLTTAARDLPDHRATIENAVRCEDLLAVLEAIFLWLCAGKGETLEASVAELPIDLGALRAAHTAFGRSGSYRVGTASVRHRLFYERFDTSSNVAIARSVLHLHEKVSDERNRSRWVWEQQGVLSSDMDVERPPERELQVGIAWRNDYYLAPLRSIAKQLAEVRG
ncbi:MAG: hypothetical protein OXJ37_16270 [Bryobacterales bacterium]|nr:hypothetical protein [Bryobacterales bacterium]MDE0620838.1 hypothetical protein [Bryobacterales bacterium]